VSNDYKKLFPEKSSGRHCKCGFDV